jgi:hypothetical protein
VKVQNHNEKWEKPKSGRDENRSQCTKWNDANFYKIPVIDKPLVVNSADWNNHELSIAPVNWIVSDKL